MSKDKGKIRFIDQFEQYACEQEGLNCKNCKHRRVPALKEPCKNCWNRDRWQPRKRGI